MKYLSPYTLALFGFIVLTFVVFSFTLSPEPENTTASVEESEVSKP